MKALSLISTSIDDTSLHLIRVKSTTRDAWTTLLNRYNGLRTLDPSNLSTHLHQFQLDDSKPLESQTNLMIDMHNQLIMLGDEMMDAKFAMIILESLPPLYETLKMFTVTTITNALLLVSDTLMTQILREERQRENHHSMAALFAKPGGSSAKSTNSIPISNSIHNPNSNAKSNHLKPKKGRTHPHCTNPKCMRISHTIECCWAKGGGLEGQQPIVPVNSQSGNVSLSRESRKNKDGNVAILIAYGHAAVAENCHFHSTEWIIDSGATSPICMNQSWFTSYSILTPSQPIILGY